MRGSRRRQLPVVASRRGGLILGLGLLLLTAGGPGVSAPRPGVGLEWTLLVQLPEGHGIVIERTGGTLRGSAAGIVPRLGRGARGVRSIRRLVAGRVSLQSRNVREVTLAGRMLVVAVTVPRGRRVRAFTTNRMPLSEDPSHLALVNLQLVAEGELNARAPFAVVDERGRTAVLFQ